MAVSTQDCYACHDEGNDYSGELPRDQRRTAKRGHASHNSISSSSVAVQAEPTARQVSQLAADAATQGELTLLRSKVFELESQMSQATTLLHTLTQTLLLQ